jgi:hypothetical protein
MRPRITSRSTKLTLKQIIAWVYRPEHRVYRLDNPLQKTSLPRLDQMLQF